MKMYHDFELGEWIVFVRDHDPSKPTYGEIIGVTPHYLEIQTTPINSKRIYNTVTYYKNVIMRHMQANLTFMQAIAACNAAMEQHNNTPKEE
jgi:hypothetical protein